MEIQVEHLGGVQFEIKARQHTIASDQPVESGGFDEGMTPPELFLASVGSCVGFYVAQYLRKHKLATEGTIIRVIADKATDPARLDNFRIALEIPGEMNQLDLEGVEEAARRCLIHNTLLHPPKIAIEVKAAELVVR